MSDLTALLSLQARSRRNALRATRLLRARRAAHEQAARCVAEAGSPDRAPGLRQEERACV